MLFFFRIRLLILTHFVLILQGDIGDENTRRLKGVVGVFICGMSNIAIFTFFAGTQVGYIFFDRLLIKGEW